MCGAEPVWRRPCGNADPFFPPLTCELVDVGEQTGNLESVLLRLGEHYQHLLRLRRAFLMGILWPAIQLVGAIVIIGLLILFFGVLGTSATVFGLSGVSGLRTYLLCVFGCAAVLFVLIRGLLRGWFGPAPTAVLMRLPVIGSTLQTMALARLAWTLSLALNAGIDARRAIRMVLASTQRAPLYGSYRGSRTSRGTRWTVPRSTGGNRRLWRGFPDRTRKCRDLGNGNRISVAIVAGLPTTRGDRHDGLSRSRIGHDLAFGCGVDRVFDLPSLLQPLFESDSRSARNDAVNAARSERAGQAAAIRFVERVKSTSLVYIYFR